MSTPEDDRTNDPIFSADADQVRATFESLVNTLPISLLIKDISGQRLFANETYLTLRGMTLENVVGKRDQDLFPPDIAQRYIADDQVVIRSGDTIRGVEQTIDTDGNRRWIERVKSPIVDRKAGTVIGVQLLFWDVTERVIAERELKHERDLLNTLLTHLPDSIYFKDRDSCFLRVSEAMAKKFGLQNADAALGKTDADIFSEEHANAAREDELKIMESREPLVDREERETWHGREDSWCLSTKMPFVDEEDNVVGTFGISRDITELKRSQDELREARDVADRANRAKSDFLANMSHEIRTPMNAIIGMSELLSQTQLSEEQEDYVELVRDSADSLLRLLNDILDFSKIEARKLELESIPFSIRDLVEKTGRTLSIRAGEKGLEIACRVAPDVPDRLMGDPGRLRQVLLNLIGNAIKFTDEGEVVAEVRLAAESEVNEETVKLHFSVSDTGVGIAEDKQAAVLEAFTQEDTSTTRRFGGTGLGLAIARQLVQLMDGELTLESRVGYGTTFRFSSPFSRTKSGNSAPSQQLKQLTELSVLVVDDNATNRRIMKEILTAWRLNPIMAEDGKSAMHEIQAAADRGNPFQLVITDCMMPEMDGFELAERIRDIYSSTQTKLIILSSAGGDDAGRCKEIGISRYMTKPVVQSELLDTLLQVMNVEKFHQEPEQETLPTCPSLRVLVAEDGIANQHVAVGMLKAAGHVAVVAADGREALSRWQNEEFDVILMDMHMPVMDGIEATRQIRALEAGSTQHIPIIAVTAAAMKEDAAACKEAGMDAYLAKPIHSRMLQTLLAEYAPDETSLASSTTQRETMASFVPADHASTSDESRGSEVAGDQYSGKVAESDDTIDFRAAASRVPGGMPGVRRLAEVFIPECESLMTTLRNELPSGDPATVQRAAHTLKGSSVLFYAKRVEEEAASIERLAQEKDLNAAADRLVLLEKEAELMMRALKNFLEITAG
ncbi:MAG: response regulator [Rubripirellula sp.]